MAGCGRGDKPTSNLFDQVHVKRRAHSQRLRERRRIAEGARAGELDAPGPRDAVERLIPPGIRRQSQTRHPRRLGLRVLDLFLLSEGGHELCSS